MRSLANQEDKSQEDEKDGGQPRLATNMRRMRTQDRGTHACDGHGRRSGEGVLYMSGEVLALTSTRQRRRMVKLLAWVSVAAFALLLLRGRRG